MSQQQAELGKEEWEMNITREVTLKFATDDTVFEFEVHTGVLTIWDESDSSPRLMAQIDFDEELLDALKVVIDQAKEEYSHV